jgi:hypothetical protein
MNRLLIISSILTVGILANIGILYAMVFSIQKDITALKQPSVAITSTQAPGDADIEHIVVSSPSAYSNPCEGCREDIDELYKLVIKATPTAGVSFSKISESNTSVKEVFIPFGSGSTKATDWEDIPGMNAMINSNNYTTIKSVTFEISLRIPTANGLVYARLYNVTDKHPVWFSELSSEGPTSMLKKSPNIALDSGDKLYQVQMKNSMQTQSIADSARIKIVLQ